MIVRLLHYLLLIRVFIPERGRSVDHIAQSAYYLPDNNILIIICAQVAVERLQLVIYLVIDDCLLGENREECLLVEDLYDRSRFDLSNVGLRVDVVLMLHDHVLDPDHLL